MVSAAASGSVILQSNKKRSVSSAIASRLLRGTKPEVSTKVWIFRCLHSFNREEQKSGCASAFPPESSIKQGNPFL